MDIRMFDLRKIATLFVGQKTHTLEKAYEKHGIQNTDFNKTHLNRFISF